MAAPVPLPAAGPGSGTSQEHPRLARPRRTDRAVEGRRSHAAPSRPPISVPGRTRSSCAQGDADMTVGARGARVRPTLPSAARHARGM